LRGVRFSEAIQFLAHFLCFFPACHYSALLFWFFFKMDVSALQTGFFCAALVQDFIAIVSSSFCQIVVVQALTRVQENPPHILVTDVVSTFPPSEKNPREAIRHFRCKFPEGQLHFSRCSFWCLLHCMIVSRVLYT